jgi:hypothetical protein
MVRLTLNVDEEVFEGSGFELIPTGRHKVTIFEITESEVKTGKNAGKPRLKFQFKIAEGEPLAGRYLFHDANAFEGTDKEGKPLPMYDLLGIGKAIGLSADQVRNFDSDEWLGEELFVTVTHEEKKTKESNYTESFDPKEYRERLKGWRSTSSVTTSLGAAEAAGGTTVKAATGAKATAKAGGKPKFTL